ncbi:hypothetical protein JVX91_00535 [Pseudomonas sp. PDNC002]|uniref:hypothetical protein n=1 Tax=Pseudomonas sp. PDNC002 TaxID=2811422 RepID=UPI001966A2AA|nr:hypothetical protein [Pseudomonas sp. PDNC002]QRY79634.1 hypothetical protein JVX91_00535 [Pseudomonas sp. PDNC002]
MSLPKLMIGGVEVLALFAGAPQQTLSPLGGPSIVRLSQGRGVPMTHWNKVAISISASGWMPPGLAGVDYSQPLEVRLTKVESIVGTHLDYQLTSAPRPDFEPYAEALIGKDWERTGITRAGLAVTVTPMAGATHYRVCWMPVFMVSGRRPQEDSDDSANTHRWSFDCEEL